MPLLVKMPGQDIANLSSPSGNNNAQRPCECHVLRLALDCPTCRRGATFAITQTKSLGAAAPRQALHIYIGLFSALRTSSPTRRRIQEPNCFQIGRSY